MVSQEAQALSRAETRTGHAGISKEFSTKMMRSFALVFTLVSGFVLSGAAQTLSAPAAAAPAGPAKIAVIAFQAAVGQTNEFQRNYADLVKKYDPKRQQLKTLSDEIDDLEKQLQAQGDKLSDAERASRAKTIDDKKKQAQRIAEDAQNDLSQEMQEVYNGVAAKVFDVLNAYAQQQGFTLVVDGSANQQQSPVVLYASPSTDITKVIIDAYNVKSGVPAPPPQPAGTAAPKPTSSAPRAPARTPGAPAAH
jgi:outer membrane protein